MTEVELGSSNCQPFRGPGDMTDFVEGGYGASYACRFDSVHVLLARFDPWRYPTPGGKPMTSVERKAAGRPCRDRTTKTRNVLKRTTHWVDVRSAPRSGHCDNGGSYDGNGSCYAFRLRTAPEAIVALGRRALAGQFRSLGKVA
jgi:hypothetical protein